MITTCKICQLPKTRSPNGSSPNGKRKYYVDENGNSWMGLKCPDCEKIKNRERMAKKRKEVKDGNSVILDTESSNINSN